MQKVAKFNIQDILPIALVLVVAGIGITYGLSVIGDIKDEMATCPYGAPNNFTYNSSNDLCYNSSLHTAPNYAPVNTEYTAANQTITGVAKLANKLPLIVTIIVAAIIIGILLRYLLVRYG